MVEVANEPPASDVFLVLDLLRGPYTPKEPGGHVPGIINAGLDGKLQGTPGPSVDLHQTEPASRRVTLELHHCDPLKPGSDHQMAAELKHFRVQRDRPAGAARAPAWVLLSNPLPLEGHARFALESETRKPNAFTSYKPLDEHIPRLSQPLLNLLVQVIPRTGVGS
jgi:hypothetical protein